MRDMVKEKACTHLKVTGVLVFLIGRSNVFELALWEVVLGRKVKPCQQRKVKQRKLKKNL